MTVHKFPPLPAFRDTPPTTPISEIAMRIVVERNGWQFHVVGTATLICGYLAITAKHVVEHAMRTYGTTYEEGDGSTIENCQITLYQVLPGPVYRVWNVPNVTLCPHTDLAFLHLALLRRSDSGAPVVWGQPVLRALPPPVGQRVIAFGYREGAAKVTAKPDGSHHIDLNDKPTTSIGVVTRNYPAGRDRVMLPFPCFEIEARFDGGMSGGLVIDEMGAVCGLICAGMQMDDPDTRPVSYAAALWPLLKTTISADRGDKYPRGVTYPAIDLAIDGLVAVTDLADLDSGLLPGWDLSNRGP